MTKMKKAKDDFKKTIAKAIKDYEKDTGEEISSIDIDVEPKHRWIGNGLGLVKSLEIDLDISTRSEVRYDSGDTNP